MSKKLFEGSGESDSEIELSTNKDYAESYNNFRKKELLKKFKDKGYEEFETDSSSESDSSEEEGIVDKKFDEEFFKTLASLKSKDPAIYDKNTKFFEIEADDEAANDDENSEEEKSPAKREKQKPVTLKDYERQIILEKGGKFEDDSDEAETVEERSKSPTIVEEERRLKAEFRKVLEHDDSEEEEFGGIFKKRQKTQQEQDEEDADFVKWLAGKQEDIKPDFKEKLEPLKQYWNSDKLPQNEKFLRDYILNKGYANAKSSEIPTYEEIIGDNAPLSEDEKELEKQDEFEQKFNFRFEDPDNEFIKRYPRTIANSIRQKDDKRKLKREETKVRKQKEKEQKRRELEMVKEMKRKEIEEKIQKLKLVTGNDELGFKDDELEEDFDPEAHDRRMQEIFNDDYYQVDEGEEKPECPSDIEELKYENWDNYDPQEDDYDYDNDEPHCEDPDFNMDCDYDPSAAKEQLQQELIENTKGKRKRRGKRNRFAEMLKQVKPAFDPDDEKTYADYIDEYYKIDCEDFIGDLPCRFKYVETTPNDFGLTFEEILLAKNKELNQWASLKKAVQIRPEHLEKKEQRLYKLKAKNEQLKRKIFKSIYGEGSDEEQEDEDIKKIKEETNQENKTEDNKEQGDNTNNANCGVNPLKKSKKRRKRKAQNSSTLETSRNKDDNENSTATEPKRLKAEENDGNEGGDDSQNSIANKKKKRKKNKNNSSSINSNQNSNNNSTSENSTKTPSQQNNPFRPIDSTNQGNTKKVNSEDQKPENVNSPSKPARRPQIGPKQNSSTLKTKFNKSNGSPANPFANDKPKFGGNGEKILPPIAKKSNHLANKLKSKKRNNFKQGKVNSQDSKITDDRLKAYGINPKKFHKKQKYSKKPTS